MKQLYRKTFAIIFLLFTIFISSGLIIFNVQNYKREYDSITRNLNFADFNKESKNIDDNYNKPGPRNLDNTMIMDYEVYTIKLENNNIQKIISHSSESSNFDVKSIANKILNSNKNKTFKIGNLYNNKYSYNFKYSDLLIIINTSEINKKLTMLLINSLLIFTCMEIFIYFISIKIAKWITKPALDSFNKQKDFIADASHELKTPLAVIMASSDELKSDKKNQKYIDNIKYESERMSLLITSMLDLSKLESGVAKKNYKEENISKIVEKICLTFEGVAYEEEVEILPNIKEDIMFKCNKEDIEKLISIILDNAIKHSYKKTVINVDMKKDKNNIKICITNHGDPIKDGDEEKIFERFYRADKSRSRDKNRYGLGLAIAKSIVLNHNGSIKANSKEGKTTFSINLKK